MGDIVSLVGRKKTPGKLDTVTEAGVLAGVALARVPGVSKALARKLIAAMSQEYFTAGGRQRAVKFYWAAHTAYEGVGESE